MTNIIEEKKRLANYMGGDRVVSSIEKVKELKANPENLFTVSTGYSYLDMLVGKLEATEIIVLTGLTKEGKTSIIMNITRNFLKENVQTLWFQYELSSWQFMKSFGGKVPKFYIPNELVNKNMDWIEERIEEAIIKYGIKVVVIDPIQYLVDYEKRSNPTTELGGIVRRTKTIAKKLNVIMIIISHARRLGKDEKLGMTAFHGCLPADQLIYSQNGNRISVKDIRIGDHVVSKGAMFRLQNDKVKSKWYTGKKKIYRLTTKTGCQLECSGEQKFLATTFHKTDKFILRSNKAGTGIQGWTKLEELKIGQKIAIVKKYPDIEREDITLGQATILGWIIGDGSIREDNYSVGVSVNTKRECLFLKKIADKEFHLNCTFKRDKRLYKGRKSKCFDFYLSGGRRGDSYNKVGHTNQLTNLLRKWKFNPKGEYKYVPAIIFKQSSKIIGAFLSGLFHADGCVIKHPTSNSIKIELDSISSQLSRDVHHLLRRVGIISYMTSHTQKPNGFSSVSRKMYRINIYGQDVIEFEKKVGFHCQKEEKLKKLMIGWVPKRRGGKKMDLFFDRIKKIEFIGVKDTWDIEVEGKHKSLPNHTYCVNDILTHNSQLIPNEADKIWLFERKKDRQGIGTNKARLIVAGDRRTGTMNSYVDFVFDTDTKTFTEEDKKADNEEGDTNKDEKILEDDPF